MIRFDRFGWRFAGASSQALDDVSLHIRRGDFVAVAGPSGSGKTTLALAMCGLLVGRQAGDARGGVYVDGRNIADTPLYEAAEKIGLVQQNPDTHFATLTVTDEIAFGMENRCVTREEIRRRSEQAMALLSITHLRDRSLSTLSGGEKQRVAVASIVAGRPDALVLDEPTASLDPEASRDLFRSLADLCREAELTVVVIEHKLAQLLPLKPRLICLDKGRVTTDIRSGGVDGGYPARLTGLGPEGFHRDVIDVAPTRGDPIVDVSRVTVRLGGQKILDDVSLRVGAGEVVAVLGPNGGGKSTLLHSLLGLVEPVAGSIRMFGAAVSKAKVSRLAGKVGLVFQNADHQLVTDSVRGEALFAARTFRRIGRATENEADRLLALAGLSERKRDHPFRLSWGQKRRLNLISAVLHQPRVLLLDEPFAGQDWENVAFLLDVIRGVVETDAASSVVEDTVPETLDEAPTEPCSMRSGGGACLMVTHDPRVVLRRCTRALFLAGGRITLDAPVPQVFERLREMGHDAYVPGDGRPPESVSPRQQAAGERLDNASIPDG